MFTFRSTSHGVTYRLLSSKNRIPAVNLQPIANLHWEVPKNFKNDTQQKLDAWTFQIYEILRLPNLLNSSPTGGHLLSVKSIKIDLAIVVY